MPLSCRLKRTMLSRLSNRMIGVLAGLVVSVVTLGVMPGPEPIVSPVLRPNTAAPEPSAPKLPAERAARAMLDREAGATEERSAEPLEGAAGAAADATERAMDEERRTADGRDERAFSSGTQTAIDSPSGGAPVIDTLAADRVFGAMGSSPTGQAEIVQSMSTFLAGLLGSGARAGNRGRSADRELPQATVDVRYCETLEAPEGAAVPGARLTSGIVPKGLILNQGNSQLCGTPTESGIFRFTVTFTFGTGPDIVRSFRLVVAEAEEGDSEGELRLATTQLAVGTVGAEYLFQLRAQGGELPYRWDVVGLPADLEFDAATGIIAGVPDAEGELLVAVSVTDRNGATASLTYSLLIRVTPIFITTHSIEEGHIGQPFQTRFGAQGGVLPYRWQLLGALPTGLTFNPTTAVLEGAPEVEFEGVLQIRVQDKEEQSDTAEIPLRIRGSELNILTAALADGFEGQPYSFALAATGGTPPYRWSITGGALPPGLALSPSGAVVGSPLSAGEFAVGFQVNDSGELQASRTVRLLVQQLAAEEPEAGSGPFPSAPPEEPPGESDDEGDDSPGPGFPGGGDPDPDDALPGATALRATGSDRKAALSWKNPEDPSFVRTVVVRSVGVAPAAPDQGTVVYAGTGTSVLDIGLENGTAYAYTAFAEYGTEAPGIARPSDPAIVTPEPVTLGGTPNPFIDRVASFAPVDAGCFNCGSVASVVLGAPLGGGETHGSIDIVSIGAKVNDDGGRSGPYGGSITLEFTDNIVVNGPGADFTIFENAFRIAGTDQYFLEPAVVEVSADGERYYRFPIDFVPHYDGKGELNLFNPFCYARGFAGVKPVYSNRSDPGSPSPLNTVRSGGDQFDLSDLPGAPVSWIRFIRITSTGDGWMVDAQGEPVRHSNIAPFYGASGKGNSGFDLDAIVALNY